MAKIGKRLSSNVDGNFYVDSTCINCDTCRQLAPATFAENGDYSSVRSQPHNPRELHQAYQALLACPVGSIGTVRSDREEMKRATASFPLQLEGGVYYNGFNSEKSFGANSYFIVDPEGNWLVDSPRYLRHLEEAFEQMGGIRYIFLSHEDDVADAARYAKRFGASRIIHRADAEAMPEAEWLVDGEEPIRVGRRVEIIPVPGHTDGSMALLYDRRFLFTGDHLWWDREAGRLEVPTRLVQSRQDLHRSTARLLGYSFEWVLPGHGDRIRLTADAMHSELERLLQRRFHIMGKPAEGR
jgi:glyoxylase-like metal-dependent hydrolase (beta-lactamase superfamily II)/ferredoxin